ncbi:MAG: type IV pili methyl-accepting chemotaxis transducer N-terminal domain-containing protein, partial [Pseudomonadota bacterium]
MNRKTTIVAFFFSALSALMMMPAHADLHAVADLQENAEQRINFSGKLRMLSQRIPAAACHLSEGIDVEGSTELLAAATAEFEKILTALELGDADLDIYQPERNARTLVDIGTLRSRWEPMRVAAEAVVNNRATAEEMDYIAQENLAVLAAAQRLVEQLVRQYSNPNAMTFASLMLIDISGRQRMLTQKMSKESCMLEAGHDTMELREDLKTTMLVFDNSLTALRDGMLDVGISPPPTRQIATGLDGVASDWQNVQPYLTDILDG